MKMQKIRITHAFDTLIWCLPTTGLSNDEWRVGGEGVVYPRVVRPEQHVVHSQSKSLQDEYAGRHDTL